LLARLTASPPDPGGWVPERPLPPPSAARPSRTGWGDLRVVPTRRAVGGLALVLAVAVVVALLLAWQARPSALAAPRVHRTPPAVAVPTGGAVVSVSRPPEVVVHVVGAVRHPGLVRLPGGSRVADAVDAAGGLSAGARAASVNLARPVVDGEQLVVQRRGRPPILSAPAAGAAGPAAPAGSSAGVPVDLNTATLEALDGLPGIGPVLAQRILDWRSAHGRFATVDELGEVSGIGEATLGDLRPLVRV
jgi:competence protein ComEA